MPDYRAALTGDIKGLKVGLLTELMDTDMGLDSQTREAVEAAVQVLAELGAEVREVSLPLASQTGAIVRTITHTERVSLRPEWLRERRRTITSTPASLYNRQPIGRVLKAQKWSHCNGSRCWTC